jgi:hypothetical protein
VVRLIDDRVDDAVDDAAADATAQGWDAMLRRLQEQADQP